MISLDLNTLAVLVALIVQTGGWIWWASNLTARIKHLEEQSKLYVDIAPRLSSLETCVKAISLTLDRVYKELQQKADK